MYDKYGVTTHEEYEAAREAEDNARGLFWMKVSHPEGGLEAPPTGQCWTLRKLTRQEAAVQRRQEYSATRQQQAKAKSHGKAAGGALVRTHSGELGTLAAKR
eukprot:COSAG05_NODE_1099_length_5888_cov_9.758335_8_plen_101_part_01